MENLTNEEQHVLVTMLGHPNGYVKQKPIVDSLVAKGYARIGNGSFGGVIVPNAGFLTKEGKEIARGIMSRTRQY